MSLGDDGEIDKYWGVNHQVSIMENIYSGWPKILSSIPEKSRNDLRFGGAVYTIWDRKAALDAIGSLTIPETNYKPFDLVNMLSSYGIFSSNLSEFKKSGVIKKVGINTVNDELVCKECESLENRVHSIASVPELPYEKCTCEFGCRCWITPKA